MPDKLEQASRVLPPHFRTAITQLSGVVRDHAEEVRLKISAPLLLRYGGGQERILHAQPLVTAHDMAILMENATKGSLHTALESLRGGFLSLEGGHRMGVCGHALIQNGNLSHVRDVSSACIRIAREHKGIAAPILPELLSYDKVENTLILSPPGAGKTSLLRDLIRMLSGGEGTSPKRVSVADERGELCGCIGGLPQLDTGPRTDIWTGLHKAEAAVMMLRGLSPQVLALDEITAPDDVKAVEMCIGCGVSVLATAHAESIEDLLCRPVYRPLTRIFTRFVMISVSEGKRRYFLDTNERMG